MKPIQFGGKGLQLLWENVMTKGISLSDITHKAASRVIQRENAPPRHNPLKHKNIRSLGFSPSSPTAAAQYYSSTFSRNSDQTVFPSYKESSNDQKVLTLTYNGLRMVGAKLPDVVYPSFSDVKDAWEKVGNLDPGFPQIDGDDPTMNLAQVVFAFPAFDARVQKAHIIEDINEAIVLQSFAADPTEMIHIPFGVDSTLDSEVGKGLIMDRVKPEAFILEDGSDNGQHLISLVHALHEHDNPVRAMGTDIAFAHTNIGRMLVSSVGMEGSVSFCAAHSLHRPSARRISGSQGQHIFIAYRLLPVFNEEKIGRYLLKLSEEMQPGDLWCGSIALPEGPLFEKNSKNKEKIQRFSIHPVPTKFCGKTYVHHPEFPGMKKDEELVSYFEKRFQGSGLKFREEDFSNVILNTYTTRDEFEKLVHRYGLSFTSDPVEVDCIDNRRLVVLLEKA